MKSDKRKFTWNNSERAAQEAAYTQISEIAEEHGIEVFFSGGEQFADRIEAAGLKPSDFTVEDFENWKKGIVNAIMDNLIDAERAAFLFVLNKKKERKKNKNKK